MQVLAPFPGHVWEVNCTTGDIVSIGDHLFVLEAMKMETPVLAASAGAALNARTVLALLWSVDGGS